MKPVDEMTDMERFAVFLRYAENPEYRDVVNRVIESKEGLAVAGEVLMSISKYERERAIFRSRRIAFADQESNRVTAERNMANAERKTKIDIAKNMIADGEPVDKVTRYTGLTRAEIEKLRDAD